MELSFLSPLQPVKTRHLDKLREWRYVCSYYATGYG